AVLSMIRTPYDWNKIWIFMVDSEGNCLTDNCISEGDVVSMNTYEISYGKLSLYPNPTRERIYWNERHALQEIRVFDLFGRQVLDRTSDTIHSVDVGGLPDGTYILEGTDREGKVHRGRFILQ
ncbi:MAG: T9SS type A sorting domain-containing protein, partial [Bacteroidetes bacterium]|nr:T9SS type A sorting domain-containing protein [Bacteroidota bacterium]